MFTGRNCAAIGTGGGASCSSAPAHLSEHEEVKEVHETQLDGHEAILVLKVSVAWAGAGGLSLTLGALLEIGWLGILLPCAR